MPENVSDLSVGLQVASQIPLNFRRFVANEAFLADLGDEDNLAYAYHKGMEFYCATEKSRYEWAEATGETRERLMPTHFTYPDNLVVNGIDYSEKQYNFFKIQNITVENVEQYIIEGPPGRGITGLVYDEFTGTLTFSFTSGPDVVTGDLRGTDGDDGRSITGVEFVSSAGLEDTYRISFSTGDPFDFVVKNGLNGDDGITPIMTRTSTTPNDIASTGTKTWNFTSAPNLGWELGTRLRFFNSATKYMEGIITSIGPTGVTAAIDYCVGSGTALDSWKIAIAGDPGTIDNAQKTLDYPADFPADNYDVVTGDNNYTIYINNGSNPVTITVDASLPNRFVAGFIQKGSGLVTFVASGVTLNSPTGGFKIKGQHYFVAIQQEQASGELTLLGNSKT